MASDFASELESVARELRRQADGELFREMTAAMRRGVEPATGAIRAGLKPHLPDPYAKVLDEDLDLTVSVSTTGREPGVSLIARSRRRLKRLDGGVIAHPFFGDRSRWYKQGEPSVQPGFFTGPARASEPRVLQNLEDVLQQVADIIDRRAAGA